MKPVAPKMKRRTSVELRIWQLKNEKRLEKQLRGAYVDATYAVLAAAAMNFSKLQFYLLRCLPCIGSIFHLVWARIGCRFQPPSRRYDLFRTDSVGWQVLDGSGERNECSAKEGHPGNLHLLARRYCASVALRRSNLPYSFNYRYLSRSPDESILCSIARGGDFRPLCDRHRLGNVACYPIDFWHGFRHSPICTSLHKKARAGEYLSPVATGGRNNNLFGNCCLRDSCCDGFCVSRNIRNSGGQQYRFDCSPRDLHRRPHRVLGALSGGEVDFLFPILPADRAKPAHFVGNLGTLTLTHRYSRKGTACNYCVGNSSFIDDGNTSGAAEEYVYNVGA